MVEFKNESFWLWRLWIYCYSNKQMGRVCVSRISMKPCRLEGRTASSQGGLGKRRLSQKCRWRSVRYKTPVGKKPTQNRSACGKKIPERLKMKHCVKSVRIRSYSGLHFPRIFPHLDWTWRDTPYLSVFSPNAGKCRKNAGQNNSEYWYFLRSESVANHSAKGWAKSIKCV